MVRYIFALNGTVTSQSILPYIAEHFNMESDIERLTKETFAGNIPYIEGFIKQVHLMTKIPPEEINSLLEKIALFPNVVMFIKEHVDQSVVVTENLDCWVEKLCRRVGCDCYSSKASVDNNRVGKLDTILRKEKIVKKYQEMGDTVVFIGEGSDDLEAMRQADISIASGLLREPSNSVLGITDYYVFKEDTLCRLLNQLL